jgi:hypothetical protein
VASRRNGWPACETCWSVTSTAATSRVQSPSSPATARSTSRPRAILPSRAQARGRRWQPTRSAADVGWVAPPGCRSALDVSVRSAGAAPGGRDFRLGLPADRRGAQGVGCLGVGHDGADRPRCGGSASVARAARHVMACVSVSARGDHVGVRLPDRRDDVSAARLRAVLHLARDATDRVRRVARRTLTAHGRPSRRAT